MKPAPGALVKIITQASADELDALAAVIVQPGEEGGYRLIGPVKKHAIVHECVEADRADVVRRRRVELADEGSKLRDDFGHGKHRSRPLNLGVPVGAKLRIKERPRDTARRNIETESIHARAGV